MECEMSEMQNYEPNDGFNDAGDDDGQRVIRGTKLSFGNDGVWTNADDAPIPANLEFVPVHVGRVLQKWDKDNMPVRGETRFLAPGEDPGVDGLNEKTPRNEWGLDFNKQQRPPWQVQNIIYLVRTENMAQFTIATSTVGGNIAISDLKAAVQLMRKFRGPSVYPVVTLASRHMNTKFGGRPRPHFEILRFIKLDPGDKAALPQSPTPSLPPSSGAPIPPKDASGASIVDQPTLREELNDDVPF
jgi:hypothetical protein